MKTARFYFSLYNFISA